MRGVLRCIVSLAVLVALVNASALTYIVDAQEKACFFGQVTKPNSKIGFYFAVQSGGAFDIDYEIKNPNGEVLVSESKERQGDFILNAAIPGEYSFCFSNDMSTFSKKVLDFEINIENEGVPAPDAHLRAELPKKASGAKSVNEETNIMMMSVENIQNKLHALLRDLQYYKTRNHRNEATVQSTESRIFFFSVFDMLLMMGMGLLQVVIVQLFFADSRKQVV